MTLLSKFLSKLKKNKILVFIVVEIIIFEVISANGELQASKALANAAKTVVDCPHALQVSSTIYTPSIQSKS